MRRTAAVPMPVPMPASMREWRLPMPHPSHLKAYVEEWVSTQTRVRATHREAPLRRCAKRSTAAAPMPTPASWPMVLSMAPSGSARLGCPLGSPNTCMKAQS